MRGCPGAAKLAWRERRAVAGARAQLTRPAGKLQLALCSPQDEARRLGAQAATVRDQAQGVWLAARRGSALLRTHLVAASVSTSFLRRAPAASSPDLSCLNAAIVSCNSATAATSRASRTIVTNASHCAKLA